MTQLGFKGGFGFHPIGVWCDNSSEMLAVKQRPGNAGANTAADHIQVLSEAIAQLPAVARKHLLIRADGAGASHAMLDWLTNVEHGQRARRPGRNIEYSVGFALTEALREALREAIALVPKKAWHVALQADGGVREHADIVEITDLLDLSRWPEGMRVIIRREHPHPGAQLSLFEERDGWRHQAFATNTALTGTMPLALLEARHRAHARVEDRSRHAKDTGLRRLPSRQANINTAWTLMVAIAADLIAWLRLLALPTELRSCEPKALRYRLLHVPAALVRTARRRILRIPKTGKWAGAVAATFTAVAAIPAPT